MHVKLHVWRQAGPSAPGAMETIDVPGISEEMSFLEMLDIVNERLNAEGRDPIAFEHDCREGICGSCGMMINGQAHGPQKRAEGRRVGKEWTNKCRSRWSPGN